MKKNPATNYNKFIEHEPNQAAIQKKNEELYAILWPYQKHVELMLTFKGIEPYDRKDIIQHAYSNIFDSGIKASDIKYCGAFFKKVIENILLDHYTEKSGYWKLKRVISKASTRESTQRFISRYYKD